MGLGAFLYPPGDTAGVSPTNRSYTEVLSREGGIFWGLVLLILGILGLLASLGVPINPVMTASVVVLVAGIWLLYNKLHPEA